MEDFLGGIAGFFDLIMYALLYCFGPYINFMSRVKWIKGIYKFDGSNEDKKLAIQDGKIDLTKINLTWFYFKNESIFS